MRILRLALALAACTDSAGGGGSGIDGVTHVIQLQFPAATNLYCFDQPLADVDATMAGTQVECSVSDVTNAGQPTQVESVLPACNNGSTNRPCWLISVDLANCPDADHMSMVIVRSGAPPTDTTVMAQCVAKGV